MKLYLDTANLEEIAEAVEWGVIDGVTTNPTLAAREKQNFLEILPEICRLVQGPVSAEVIAQDTQGMVEEARALAAVAPNIVIKIPINQAGLRAVHLLRKENIKTNVTLVFSINQALMAAQAGASYVSPFVGRLDDIGHDGIALVRDLVAIFSRYQLDTEIIAASIRHPWHVAAAASVGAHIATVPMNVLRRMFSHPLTDRGIERFLADWQKRLQE